LSEFGNNSKLQGSQKRVISLGVSAAHASM